ncbi:hypothetical protein C8R42DRAFT_724313 [Lentinula raphanica]|nr:hypothetical protein C8R42DRAFT_724313 [Lentinula raphanica]
MSSRKAGSSSTHKQYAVRELRSKASTIEDFKFNTQLRARDSITAKKQVLFLPASKRECDLLRQAWPAHTNTFDSAFTLKLYADPEPDTLPSSPSSDQKTKIPDTFYPELLVQYVKEFERGAVCREEGFLLYQALNIVQDALADVMDEPKAKTKDALLSMLKNSQVTNALGYYRLFWHKTRCCPLFALRFICLFCDFCAKVLSKAEYTAKVYNEEARRGFGVDATLRTKVRALKGPAHNVTSLAIPLPLDPSTFEGQLLITVAQAGPAAQVLRHPVTNAILLPDPSGVADLPPASPLLNAWEDEDFSMEGPASPIDEPEGLASPVLELAEDDDGETEVSDDIAAEDVFKAPKDKGKAKASIEIPIRRSPRISIPKATVAKVGPPVTSRPIPKPIKRERGASPLVVDVEMQAPAAKKAKTTKETSPPQVADAATPKTSKVSKASVAMHDVATEPEVPLDHNDLDTRTHHTLFLTNPNFQVKTAFADLVEQDSGVKRRPEMQILRSSAWTVDDELKGLGAFLTTRGVSFSLQNLGRFGHLISRRLIHEDSESAVAEPDLYPAMDCVSCQVRGLTCTAGSRLGGPCQGCTQSHRTCPSALHLNLQSDLLQELPKSVQSLPGGYTSALDRFQAGLESYFRAQELAQEMWNLSAYNLSQLIHNLKASGLDANVVLSAWAKEHPDDKLSYDDATLFATFFDWNSSCNLSAYLEKPEEVEKLQQFLKAHQLDLPSVPSTSGEAASVPVEPPVAEQRKTYSAMHASNWNVEATAKPDEPDTPLPEEQKP